MCVTGKSNTRLSLCEIPATFSLYILLLLLLLKWELFSYEAVEMWLLMAVFQFSLNSNYFKKLRKLPAERNPENAMDDKPASRLFLY